MKGHREGSWRIPWTHLSGARGPPFQCRAIATLKQRHRLWVGRAGPVQAAAGVAILAFRLVRCVTRNSNSRYQPTSRCFA